MHPSPSHARSLRCGPPEGEGPQACLPYRLVSSQRLVNGDMCVARRRGGLCGLRPCPISFKIFPAWCGEAPGCWPADYKTSRSTDNGIFIIVHGTPPVAVPCVLGDRTLFVQTVFGSKWQLLLLWYY